MHGRTLLQPNHHMCEDPLPDSKCELPQPPIFMNDDLEFLNHPDMENNRELTNQQKPKKRKMFSNEFGM